MGYASVELMRQHVGRTLRPEVMGDIGGFSGASSLADIKDMEDPVPPFGIDGVGTKLKIAPLLNRHDTIDVDCITTCVDDVICADDEPLFSFNYTACGKNVPEKIATIVSGVTEGCAQVSCALTGGETAEHPGLMPEDEHDLMGFSIGVCDRKDLITGEELKPDNVLVGIVSSGVHSNDFSLVCNTFEIGGENLTRFHPKLGTTLGEVSLASACICMKILESTKEASVRIYVCSHITGGGSYESVPRMLRGGVHAEIRKDFCEVPAIFRPMIEKGEVSEHAIYNIFNMGVGMVAAADPADAEKTIETFRTTGEKSFAIGEYKVGERDIDLC